MATEIKTYGDSVLRRVADPLGNIDAQTKKIAEQMVEAMIRANGVGLAAPQIGISKRIIVLDLDGQFHILVNPEIIETSSESEEAIEGCLSVPGVDAEVTRKVRAHVRGITLDEKELDIEGEGLMARAMQHEIDHLNGILFIDHLGPAKKRSIISEYHRKQREKVE
ncbi:MAG TPA: peptide deformylase [Candidatus Acetothermia bacterium]|nr:peptide deformylase [Candidatus Acetothermia bacterium]